MSSIQVTGVVSTECSPTAVAYKLSTPITEAVLKEAEKSNGNEHLRMRLAGDGTTVVIEGRVFPPSESLAGSTAELLSYAYDKIKEAEEREERNHRNLVEQYAKAANLPILEE